MKAISNFIDHQHPLDFGIISKITGGYGAVATNSSEIVNDGCGGCQQVNTTDSFNDCNGNGIWDEGESGSSVSTVHQVECPKQ